MTAMDHAAFIFGALSFAFILCCPVPAGERVDYAPFANALPASNVADKYFISPTPDTNALRGVYIPKDLDDAFAELETMLTPEYIDQFKACSREEAHGRQYHFGLGRWIRWKWGLWGGSRLHDYFSSLGVDHGDAISGIILESFWRHLNDNPIDLQGQVSEHLIFPEEQKKALKDIRERQAAVEASKPLYQKNLEERLKGYILPTLRYRHETVASVVADFNEILRVQTNDGEAISVVLEYDQASTRTVNCNLRRIDAHSALLYITEFSGLAMQYGTNKVAIVDQEEQEGSNQAFEAIGDRVSPHPQR